VKCFHPMCNKPFGTALFRVNVKGVKGIWACEEHMKNTDAVIPPEVDELVRAIERKPTDLES